MNRVAKELIGLAKELLNEEGRSRTSAYYIPYDSNKEREEFVLDIVASGRRLTHNGNDFMDWGDRVAGDIREIIGRLLDNGDIVVEGNRVVLTEAGAKRSDESPIKAGF